MGYPGVFDVDDDAMDALVLSPYEQLTLQLDKYFEAVSHGNKVEGYNFFCFMEANTLKDGYHYSKDTNSIIIFFLKLQNSSLLLNPASCIPQFTFLIKKLEI